MQSEYINLLFILAKKSSRDSIKPFKCPPPFDGIVRDMYNSGSDFTREDILALCVLHNMQPSMVEPIKSYTGVTPVIEEVTLLRLDALSREQEILNVFKSNEPVEIKLKKIQDISSKLLEPYQSYVKRVSDLSNIDMDDVCSFLGYPLMRGELGVLCAFPKRGKTTVLLSHTQEYSNNGLKCLYISVADFTEQTLRKRLTPTFPDILVACVPHCNIRQLRKEVDMYTPDVLIVDYIGVIGAGRGITDPRIKHNTVVQELKRLAQEAHMVVLSAHQLNTDVLQPEAIHLAESHFGVLAGLDICLGMGGYAYDSRRYVTTLASRRHQALTTFQITVNFTDLVVV